jgi:hypothetical protein
VQVTAIIPALTSDRLQNTDKCAVIKVDHKYTLAPLKLINFIHE